MNYKSDFHKKFQHKNFYEELISLSTLLVQTITVNLNMFFFFFFQFSFCLYTNI